MKLKHLLILLFVFSCNDLFTQCIGLSSIITGNNCVGSTLSASSNFNFNSIIWQLNGNTVQTKQATYALSGFAGVDAANITLPNGVASDNNGNIYVADQYNQRIVKFIAGNTNPNNGITVAGGNGSGSGLNQLSNPTGVAVDATGNIYVSDQTNHRIIQFPAGSTSASNGVVVAGGNGGGSGLNQLYNPSGVVLDASKNVYVTDYYNHRIMKFAAGSTSASSGTVVAGGNGNGSALNQLYYPTGLALDGSNNVYVADQSNNRIIKFAAGSTSASNGTIVAGGNGYGSELNQFNNPNAIAIDASNNMYISDYANSRIIKFAAGSTSASNGTIVFGTQQGNGLSQLNNPNGLAIDASTGNLYISDYGNNRILKITTATTNIFNPTIIAGKSSYLNPAAVVVDGSGNTYVGTGDRILKFATGSGVGSSGTIVAGGNGIGAGLNQFNCAINGLALDASNNIYISDSYNYRIMKFPAGGSSASNGTLVAGKGLLYLLSAPGNSIVDASGNTYVSDADNNRVLKFPSGSTSATNGIVVAGGNGYGTGLNQLNNPRGLALDASNNLYIADQNNNRVLKFPTGSTSATSGTIVAGGNGTGGALNQLNGPLGIAFDAAYNLYVTDPNYGRILKFTSGSTSATNGIVVAGGGTSSLNQLSNPSAVTVDGSGNVYVADTYNYRVIKFASGSTSGSNGTVIAGGNSYGSGLNQLSYPVGVALDASNNVYIADQQNQRIIKFNAGSTSASSGTVVAGGNASGTGLNQLSGPSDVFVDKTSGNIYISDMGNNRVIKFLAGSTSASSGSVVAGANDAINRNLNPGGLVVDASNNIYISNNDRVVKFASGNATLTNGGILAGGNGYGSGLNQLYSCAGIAFDVSNNLYVADAGNNRILKFAAGSTSATNGTVVAGGNNSGSGLNQLSNPQGVVTDASGNIYIVDQYNQRIIKFTSGSTSASNGTIVAGGNSQGNNLNQLNYPNSIGIDQSTNTIYVSDQPNQRIIKFASGSTSTSNGIVVAGPGSLYSINNPRKAVRDAASGAVYVVDAGNNRIIKFASGSVSGNSGTVVAGGNGSGSALNQLSSPNDIAFDASNNIYIADKNNHRVIKFASGSTSASNGTIVAGGNNSGSALNQLNNPSSLVVDASGNVYVSDNGNHRILKFASGSTSSSNGTVVAGGNGSGSNLNQLYNPNGVALDASNNLYISDSSNSRVIKFASGSTSSSNGTVVAGGNGNGTGLNQLYSPNGIALDATANVYIPDYMGHRIIKFAAGSTSSSNGTVVAYSANFFPASVFIDATGIFTSDYSSNYIYSFPLASAVPSGVLVAGGITAISGANTNQLYGPGSVALDASGNVYVVDVNNYRVLKFAAGSSLASSGTVVAGGNGQGTGLNQLSYSTGIALDASNNIYIVDQYNQRVLKFAAGSTSASYGTIVAGGNSSGSGLNQLSSPLGVALDALNNVYVADSYNHRILKFAAGSTSASNGIVVAGGNGGGTTLNQLYYPSAVTLDASNNVYVADQQNQRIVKFAAGSTSASFGTVVAGGNNSGSGLNQLNYPNGVALDALGNVYVSDQTNRRIIKFTAGSTSASSGIVVANGNGSGLNSFSPTGIAIDAVTGSFYISDNANSRVIKNSLISPDNSYITKSLGDYKAVLNAANGCIITTPTFSISNITVPSLKVTLVSPNVCAGNPVTLTAIPTNGGAAPIYQWYKNGVAIANATSATYTDNAFNNNDSVRCVLISNASCVVTTPVTSNTVIMQVNNVPAMPAITTNNTTILTGGTLALSANTTNVNSYSWTGPNSFTSALQNPVINNVVAANAGLYTVNATNVCGTSQASINISVSSVLVKKNTLLIDNVNCVTGNVAIVAIRVKNFNFVSGLQGTIQWDKTTLQYNATLLGNSAIAFDTTLPYPTINTSQASKDGLLTFNWFDNSLTGQTLTDSTVLFSIRFTAIRNVATPALLSFIKSPSDLEIDVINASTGLPVVSLDTVFTPGSVNTATNIAALKPYYNNPVVLGDTLKLYSTFIAGATYLWTGPNFHSYNKMNDTIANTSSVHAGIYKITATLGTCTTIPDSVSVSFVSSFNMSGTVRSISGSTVNGVTLNVNNGTNTSSFITTANGQYSFNGLPRLSYIITPSKANDVNKANGVSAIDIINIQAHILNKTLLNSPYKIIAADVDNNGKISALDLVYLKRFILGIDATFPGGRLWAFVDSNYTFPNVNNPFPYPNADTFKNLLADKFKQTFIGIKLGDVDPNWNSTIAKAQLQTNTPVELYYDDINASTNNEIKLPIKAKNFKELKSIQFTLHFNPEVLEWKRIDNRALRIDYGATRANEGILTLLWSDENVNDISLSEETVLFDLVFKKKSKLCNEDIFIDGSITAAEASGKNFELHPIIKGKGMMNEYQNDKDSFVFSPNPSKGKITVNLVANENKIIKLSVINSLGKSVFSKTISVAAGNQSISLDLNETSKIASGLYFLKADGLNDSSLKKLIITE